MLPPRDHHPPQPWLLIIVGVTLVGLFALIRLAAGPDAGVGPGEADSSSPVTPPSPVAAAPTGEDTTPGPSSNASRAALSGPDVSALEIGPGADVEDRTLRGTIVGPDGDPIQAEVVFAPKNPQGVPLELADAVELWDEFETVRTICDVDGRFVLPLSEDFDGDFDGGFGLTAIHRGCVPLRLDWLPLAARHDVDGSLDLGTLQLQRGRVVRGRVNDRSGAPIVGASVGLGIVAKQQGFGVYVPARGVPLAVTDTAGEFRLAELAEGAFTLHFEAPGFLTTRCASEAKPDGSTRCHVVMEPGVALAGRIVGLEGSARIEPQRLQVEARPILSFDDDDEEPFVNAPELVQSPRAAAVAPDGSFALIGLLPDRGHTLIVTRAGDDGGRVRAGEVEQFDVAPGAVEAELHWRPAIRTELSVVDGASGAPVEEFWVQWGHVEATDPEADADALDLPHELRDKSGDYVTRHPGGRVTVERFGQPSLDRHLTLRITAFGYASKLATIDGPSARTRTVDGRLDLGVIALTPKPAIVCRAVMASSGEAVPGAEVLVLDERYGDALRYLTRRRYKGDDEWLRRARAGLDGRVVISQPPRPIVSIAARAPGLRVRRATRLDLTATPQGAATPQAEVVLELEPAGSVEATARFRDGSPARNATFVLRATSVEDGEPREYWELTADRQGRASFGDLLAGNYELALVDPQLEDRGGRYSWSQLTVRGGEVTRHALTAAPVATLRGRVFSDGVALSGADVWVQPVLRPMHALDGAAEQEERDEEDDEGDEEDVYQGDQSGGSSHYAATERDGRFQLGPVSIGSWRLVVAHMNRAVPEVREIELQEGLNSVDVHLTSTEVFGRLVDDEGRPMGKTPLEISLSDGMQPWSFGKAQVLVECPDGSGDYEARSRVERHVSTDIEGRFRFSGLPAERPLELFIWVEWVEEIVPVQPLSAGEQRDLGDVIVRRVGVLVVELEKDTARVPYELRLYSQADGAELEDRRIRVQRRTAEHSWTLPPGEYRVEVVELVPDGLKRSLDVVVHPEEETRYQLHGP